METTTIIGLAIFAAYMLAVLGPLSLAVFFHGACQPVAADVRSGDCNRARPEAEHALKRTPKTEYDPETGSL
ncbi:hypothetical protein [Polycyclovorans algicola]|jgi:hypothetical protein|uniref:hypothetical protein n=1 Tax=Polycyclovorans algicola TaxID=616992 RepID=UPI0004A6D51C|nr:hypothetical protein [Polycyclovorans algicola]|tara:strand:+ start:17798 stop:18013 length:216 start_codon:yes stop_codon:yes gene_type:complete